jgi:hypothetical protein
VMACSSCGKVISENEEYLFAGKPRCEDCAIKAGLYPLSHTGLRRDKISEKGRCLTVPKPDIR